MQLGNHELIAISPLDDRYWSKIHSLSSYFSEYALIKYRVLTEIHYFRFLWQHGFKKPISKAMDQALSSIVVSFDEEEAQKVKKIEKRVNHDVKAVEYYLREKFEKYNLDYAEFIHFGLTSEDINSLSYALALSDARRKIIIPALDKLIWSITEKANNYKSLAVLARTHGQPAVPTTVGKELIIFATRLALETGKLEALPIEGKLTGAVGNFNAHLAAYPNIDWISLSDNCIRDLGLIPNHVTTQIIPADSYIRVFQALELINSILIGFSQDMWRYISDGYFIQEVKDGEVGSSTMPQKVNPIDFENAEGNLGLANSLFGYFASKLPISRLQRDLSDSTVKRSFGTAFGYSLLSYESLLTGLAKVSANKETIRQTLEDHWEVITEGIQTILRTSGDPLAYEKVKEFSRGKHITEKEVRSFISSLNVSPSIKKQLTALTPTDYIGLAVELVEQATADIRRSRASQTYPIKERNL